MGCRDEGVDYIDYPALVVDALSLNGAVRFDCLTTANHREVNRRADDNAFIARCR